MVPLTQSPPPAACMAAMIVAAIESGNSQPGINALMQQWAHAMGATADLAPMTPEGRLLYLLALIQLHR